MDEHLITVLANEPDNAIEFQRRVVQLKRVASGVRTHEAALRRFLTAEQRQVLRDAAEILNSMQLHLSKAIAIKFKRARTRTERI